MEKIHQGLCLKLRDIVDKTENKITRKGYTIL